MLAGYRRTTRYFTITGSFDNPAGFATILATGFPLGLYLLSKLQRWKRYALIASQLVIWVALVLSGSRAGTLAIVFSTIVFALAIDRKRLLKLIFRRRWILLPVATALLGGAFLLYQQKKDSTNGRLLIWQVSWQMIKDKSLPGHGYGAFQSKYMDYQAAYFKEHPDSKLALLADNVKHPFNEFLKVAVEFGLAGLLLVLTLFVWVIYISIRKVGTHTPLVLSALTALFVLACFSYPFYYTASWLLLAFYLSFMLPAKEFKLTYTKAAISLRLLIAGICFVGIVYLLRQIQAEMNWKEIAIKSLRGQTEEMLPEYEKLYLDSPLKNHPLFLYNYGAELNHVGHYIQSNAILTECRKKFNDYDLQMLLAYNYEQTGKIGLALQRYQHAVEMIPCRFIPLYRLFKHYKENGNIERAREYAEQIACKQIKIPSPTVRAITLEAKNFLISDQQSPDKRHKKNTLPKY